MVISTQFSYHNFMPIIYNSPSLMVQKKINLFTKWNVKAEPVGRLPHDTLEKHENQCKIAVDFIPFFSDILYNI